MGSKDRGGVKYVHGGRVGSVVKLHLPVTAERDTLDSITCVILSVNVQYKN